MKTMKRIAALLLALCMLIGMPMSVSAVGTATPSDLKPIGAQVYPVNSVIPGSNFNTNGTWGDKTVCLYFNQKLASFASATSVIRMAAVDASGAVVKIGNTTYAWKLTGHTETNWNLAGCMVALGTYGNGYSTAKTWTEITAWLASHADAGYRLRVFIYENGTYTPNNGKVDSLKAAADSGIVMPASGYTGTGSDRLGMSNRDYVTVDIGTVATGATVITPATLATLNGAQMTNDTEMTLTFSEEIAIDTARTDAVMQVVSADGKTVYNSYPVSLTATGSAALSENTWTEVEAVLTANVGSYARLKLTEKNVVNARDERLGNQVLDTVWGANTEHPLKASGERTDKGVADYVYCTVMSQEDSLLTLKNAQVQSIEGKDYIVLTFSHPVSWNTSNLGGYISLNKINQKAQVLENRALVKEDMRYYGASGKQVILPLRILDTDTGFGGKKTIADIRAWLGDLGTNRLVVRIIDQTANASTHNGYVDCFWRTEKPNITLTSNQVSGGEEWSIVDLAQQPIDALAVKGVYVYKERNLIVTFDRNAVVSPNLYSAIRLVDADNRLYYANRNDGGATVYSATKAGAATATLQWMINRTTLDNGQNVSKYEYYGESQQQVLGALTIDYATLKQIEAEAEAYLSKDLTLKLVLEEKNADSTYGLIGDRNYVVDSIYAADGSGCLPSSKGNANGHYVDLTDAKAITLADAYAVSNSAVEFVFSAPIRTDVYSDSKTATVGLQVFRADGTPYTTNVGDAITYSGVLTAVQASGNDTEGYSRWQLGDLKQSGKYSKVVNIVDILAAMNADKGQFAGCQLRLTITEDIDNGDVVGWIDNITSADGHDMLKANLGDSMADVDVDDVDDNAVTVKKVEAITENKLKVTFSEEVKMTSTLQGLVRLTDAEGFTIAYENGNYIKKTATGPNWIQWAGSLAPVEGASDDEWIVTLTFASQAAKSFTNSYAFSRIYDAWEKEWKSKGYVLNFTLEDGDVRGNGLIDQIESVATGRKLVADNLLGGTADKSGWNDFSHTDICTTGSFFESTTPQVTEVKQYSKNQVLISFDQPMSFYNVTFAQPYIGLRLVGDENLAVCYLNVETNEICHDANTKYADGAPQYWNELTKTGTRDEICKDANGEIQYDKDGNPIKNARRKNTVLQWSSTAKAFTEDGMHMFVTFADNVDVAALVNEDNLKDYMKDGYSVMLCIEETDTKDGNFNREDKLIHNFVNEAGRQLKANRPSSGNDGLLMPVTPIDPDAPVTVVDCKITGETEITFRFSEPVDIGSNVNIGFLRYVDKNNGRLFKTEDGYIQWSGILSYADETKTQLTWRIKANNPANKELARGGLAEIFDLVKTEDSLKDLDGEFMLCLEETGGNKVVGFIDSFFAVSGKTIEAQPFIPGWNDGIYIPVDPTQVIRGELDIVKAEAVTDNEMVVTFSAPVKLNGSPWFCVRLFDASNKLMYKNKAAMQWGMDMVSISDDGTQIRLALRSSSGMDVHSLTDILAYDWNTVAEGAHIRFYIEEKDEQMVTYNGHVDNIVLSSNARIHLDATDFNERDGAGIAITMGYNPATIKTTATVINESQLRITFSQRVNINGDVYMGLCYVDDDYNLLSHLGLNKSYPQWGGSWKWENESHTSIIWTMNAGMYGCKTISDIANKKGILADLYADAKMQLRIEEKDSKEFHAVGWTGLVDNISTMDGKIHLSAKGNGMDRHFINVNNTKALVGDEVQLLSVKAIDNQTMELTFSEAVTIKEGEQAPIMAIRYLTASGGTEVGTDGRTISFSGTWKYKDENKDVIIWTLDEAKAAKRGVTSLDDIFTFANDLRWNEGARIAFVVMDDKEYAFNGASMRVGGITDMSGYRNLVANYGADVSQVQMDIEIGYDLPVSTQEIEETVFVTNYLPYILIGAAVIVAGIIVSVVFATKRKKED